MKLFKTQKGIIVQHKEVFFLLNENWDTLVNTENLYGFLNDLLEKNEAIDKSLAVSMIKNELLPPVGQQEVWAAGVTYLRSRDARMEESEKSGGASLYDRVYEADRPELFFKAMPHRVAGHGQVVYIRKDSAWNVPEPELTLFINSAGTIQGYTIGNDMSSRSIEGENALYLPQAKIYERSAALGPCLYVPEAAISRDAGIKMIIKRNGEVVYNDSTAISKMKRSFSELKNYLFSECDFPMGAFLMTGTCLVPPDDFTLNANDEVEITIDEIGTLVNTIGVKK